MDEKNKQTQKQKNITTTIFCKAHMPEKSETHQQG